MAIADVLSQSAAVDTALASLKTALDARAAAAAASGSPINSKHLSDEGLLYALNQAGLTPYFPRLPAQVTRSTLLGWDAANLSVGVARQSGPSLPGGNLSSGADNLPSSPGYGPNGPVTGNRSAS